MLLIVALALAALLLWGRLAERHAVLVRESDRLAVQARAVEQSLTQQLRSLYAALTGLRDDLPGFGDSERGSRAVMRMEALRDVMPAVKSLYWVDADGRVRASSQPSDSGRDESAAPWLASVRARPEPGVLFVSQPFDDADGMRTLRLSLPAPTPQGSLSGVLGATLDTAFLDTLLGSVVYAADVSAAVLHGSGALLLIQPEGAAPASLQTADAGDRLLARLVIQPAGLVMAPPLVLAIRRDVAGALAGWQRQSELIGSFYAASLLAAVLALRTVQRRRSEQQRQADAQAAREAAEAERLRLALAGADLALWDLDLVADHSTVNERWSTMLGYTVGEVEADDAGWQALIHPEDRERVVAAQDAHMQGRTPAFEATYRLRHRDGRWIWVLDRGRVLERDGHGRPLRMVGTHMDVSERVAAEETLRRSEESLAITLQSIGDAVIATDAQGLVTRINDTARRLTGWAGDSALGRPLTEVFRIYQATTREPERDPAQRVLASGAVVGLAGGTLLVARDGAEYQVADSAAPIRAADGSIVGVVLVFSDVTEQYRMLQALRLSEQKSRALLAALDSGVVVHGADTRIVDANPAACRMLGLTLEQMRGKPDVDPAWAFLEEDGQTMDVARYPVNQARRLGETVRNLVVGIRRRDLSHPTWVLCSAFPLHGEQGELQQVVVTLADFTERKQAQEAQARSESRLRLAGRLARLGGFRIDLPGGQLWLAAEAATVLGIEPGQPMTIAQLLPQVAPHQHAQLQQALDGGQAYDMEIEFVTRAGQTLQLRVLGEPVHDAGGQVVALQGALQDVTESRREQQQLRLLETAVARLNDIVLITAPEPLGAPGPAIVFANAAFERLTGWPVADVIGRSAGRLVGPDTDVAEVERFARSLARQQAVRGELLHYGRDGRSFWVDTEVVPLLDAGGTTRYLVAVLRDITERRALEHQLREAQKIESIGTLAGGIAHDFNNILAAILGNVALARDDLPAGHAALASLEQINRAGLRARSLVQQILTFSRRETQAQVTQPLQPVVEETLSLLRATLPGTVQLHASLDPQPLAVRADATQLQQVLMNLCTNAWHALPEGQGEIRVGLVRSEAADVAGGPWPENPPALAWAHLSVADNGVGMDAATRERVFDPFFTTKPVGQGTGLGLSVVHGIVRGHGGRIWVDSAPGQGSTFHVLLPLDAPPPAAADAPALATVAAPPPPPGRHVLYVDDDEVMALVVMRLLQRAGYEVSTCSGAVDALEQVRQAPWRFDIVVTDHNMPEMTGTELAQRLARLRATLPVVINSGYVTEALRREAAQAGVRALLQKEHTLERLAGVVHEVLAEGR